MYKKFFAVFAFTLFVVMILAVAVQGSENKDSNKRLGDTDEHGCISAAGYTWNEDEQKCVREWETGEARYQNKEQSQTQTRVQDGTHVSEGGQMFKIQTQANNRIKLEAGGISAECDCNMTQEKVKNKTMLKVQLSNGKNAEVKIMPDTASERALERLRLKVCSEENGCQIQLKEVGENSEKRQLAYEIQIQRHSRILGIFQAKMQIQTQVDAENGEVIQINKPWWAFLATEPAEE